MVRLAVDVDRLNIDKIFSAVRTTTALPKRPAIPSRANDQRDGSTIPLHPTPNDAQRRQDYARKRHLQDTAQTPTRRHQTSRIAKTIHRRAHRPDRSRQNSRATNEGRPQGSIRPGAQLYRLRTREKANGLCTTTKGARAIRHTQLHKGCALTHGTEGEEIQGSESVGGCQYTAIRKLTLTLPSEIF